MMKRLLSLLLVCMMLCTMLPTAALASEQPPAEVSPSPSVSPSLEEDTGVPASSEEPEPTEVPEDPAPSEEPDAPEAGESPADSQVPAEPAQDAEPSAEPEVVAAAADEPAPVAETPITGTLVLHFRETKAPFLDIPDTKYNMWVTLSGGLMTADNYTYSLSGPSGSVNMQNGKVVGSKNNAWLWQVDKSALRQGTYTVTVTSKDPNVTGSLSASVTLKTVIFETGSKGTFNVGGTSYTCYVDSSETLMFLNIAFVLPSVNVNESANGASFIGWSKKPDASGYEDVTNQLVPGDFGGSNSVTFYAAYGTEKTYSFTLTAGGQTLEREGAYTFPSKNIGSTPDPVIFCFTNTGNQEITIGRIGSLSNFNSDMPSSFNISTEGTYDVTITPKSGLRAGTYEDNLQVMFNRGIYTYHLTFTVNSGSILVSPPTEIHKDYGKSWTQNDILDRITARADQEGGGTVDYGQLNLTLENEGFAATAPVKEGGYPYTLQVPNSVDFKASLAPGEYKLYVDPVQPKGSATAGQVSVGETLGNASLSGSFTHPDYPGWTVSGSLTWLDNPEEVLDQATTVQRRWKFTPSDPNYTELTGEAVVVVSEKQATTVTAPSETVFAYDGRPHPLQFTSDRGGDIQVWYRPDGSQSEGDWTQDAPVDAGTYEVMAKVEASGVYAEGFAQAKMTITQRAVSFSFEASSSKPYDGTKEVPNPKVYVQGTVQGDKVEAEYKVALDDANAGARIATFEVTGLTGDDAANYTLPVRTTFRHNVQVVKKTVTIKGDTYKTYGQDLLLSGREFQVTGLIEGDSLTDLGAAFSCAGLVGTADVGSYPITVTLNSLNYQLQYSSSTDRNNSVGFLNVLKADPVLHSNIVTSVAEKGALLSSVTVSGEFVNPNNAAMVVEGSFRWADPNITLPTDKNSYEAAWVFDLAPGFEKNYNVPKGGTVVLDLVDEEPLPMTAEAQTVVYTGQPQAFTNFFFFEEPASFSCQYRKHTDLVHAISLLSVGNKWTDEEPVDAGTYDVLFSAVPKPGSKYGPNSIEAIHLTITPATPDFVQDQKITVPEGTLLSDPSVAALLAVPTGVKGEELTGTFSWTTPNVTITEDGETFQWAFTADSGNYIPATGTVTVTLAADTRTVKAKVYNLPGDRPDYAVVDVNESGLKLGDKVTFFRDAACTDPESAATVVAQEDVQSGKLTVNLDAGALAAEGGTIYARITSVKKNDPSALTYGAEPTLTLLENGIVCDDGEINLPEVGVRCTVSVALQGEGYIIEKAEYGLQQSGSAFTVSPDGILTAASGGEATLTATVTLQHPDPAKSGETIVLNVQAKVVCHGAVKDKVQSDPALSGTLTGGSSLLESVMTPEEIKRAEKSGAVVEVVLSVEAIEPPADAGIVKQACGSEYEVGQYMAIDLTRYVITASGSEPPVGITETKKPLTIQVSIPEDLVTRLGSLFGKDFAVVRVHDGHSAVLPDLDSAPYTVTFESDLFSTYALVYKDSENVGSLTVTNTVTGNEGDQTKDFSYTVTVTYPEAEAYGGYVLDEKFGDLEFTDGSASFTLKGGESVTLEGLLAGGVFTVVQQPEKDYYTTQTGATGTVKKDVATKAAFTNKRDILTVTFDGNGGKMGGSGLTTAKTGPDGTLGGTKLPTPTKTGGYFAGWYTARPGGVKISETTVFEKDTIVYAHWSKVPLTGDENDPALWAALLGVSALAICAGAVVLLRRKKKN